MASIFDWNYDDCDNWEVDSTDEELIDDCETDDSIDSYLSADEVVDLLEDEDCNDDDFFYSEEDDMLRKAADEIFGFDEEVIDDCDTDDDVFVYPRDKNIFDKLGEIDNTSVKEDLSCDTVLINLSEAISAYKLLSPEKQKAIKEEIRNNEMDLCELMMESPLDMFMNNCSDSDTPQIYELIEGDEFLFLIANNRVVISEESFDKITDFTFGLDAFNYTMDGKEYEVAYSSIRYNNISGYRFLDKISNNGLIMRFFYLADAMYYANKWADYIVMKDIFGSNVTDKNVEWSDGNMKKVLSTAYGLSEDIIDWICVSVLKNKRDVTLGTYFDFPNAVVNITHNYVDSVCSYNDFECITSKELELDNKLGSYSIGVDNILVDYEFTLEQDKTCVMKLKIDSNFSEKIIIQNIDTVPVDIKISGKKLRLDPAERIEYSVSLKPI